MSNNTQLNIGKSGDVISTDDINGVKHQRVKVQYGDEGSATDVSTSAPLPVSDPASSVTSAAVSAAANAISSVNSRTAATLAAGAIFQGTVEDVSAYGRVGVSVSSDNATDGILTMEVSHDNVTWGGPARTWADTRFAEPHMWNIVEKYFRIKYINGTTQATALSIQVRSSYCIFLLT